MIGVAVSIPLSVYIAHSLDRSADKRRMQRSLQAVAIGVRHELEYVSADLPKLAIKRIENNRPPRHTYVLVANATHLAESSIHQSIITARGIYGDRLKHDLRKTLTRMTFTWGNFRKILLMRIPAFAERVTEATTSDEIVEWLIDGLRTHFELSLELLSQIDRALHKKTDDRKLRAQLDDSLIEYRRFLPACIEYVLSTHHDDPGDLANIGPQHA